eukprot:COSAG01_NODE_256_length_20138_cov_24.233694_8_plen_135_part_00
MLRRFSQKLQSTNLCFGVGTHSAAAAAAAVTAASPEGKEGEAQHAVRGYGLPRGGGLRAAPPAPDMRGMAEGRARVGRVSVERPCAGDLAAMEAHMRDLSTALGFSSHVGVTTWSQRNFGTLYMVTSPAYQALL